MSVYANAFAVASLILAADVANAGTFTLAYPSGTTQQSFDSGLVGPDGYAILNDNDKYTVAASKVSFAFGASLITVTNSSGVTWPAGTRVALNFDNQDGNNLTVLTFPVELAAIGGNVDVVTDCRPGIAGTIEHVEFVVTTPVTTAAKLATLTPSIGGTPITGGAVALTSALATPMGKVIANTTEPSAANVLTKESKLGIKATGVTAFAEGRGYILLRIRKTLSNTI